MMKFFLPSKRDDNFKKKNLRLRPNHQYCDNNIVYTSTTDFDFVSSCICITVIVLS